MARSGAAGSRLNVSAAVTPGVDRVTILFHDFVSLGMRNFIVLLATLSLVVSCRKDPDPVLIKKPAGNDTSDTDTVPSGNSDLVIRFTPVAGTSTVSSATQFYQNGKGDQFTVSAFNFYISNVRLRKNDDTWHAVPESYYLLKLMEHRDSLVIGNIPAGYYTDIEFLIGVDSVRNVSGAQTGALDVGHNMFWDWSTGYIFYKLEGEYVSSSSMAGYYGFHLGGFSGPHHCLRSASMRLGSARIDRQSVYVVKATADAAAVFEKPHDIDFDTFFSQGASAEMFARQADNYADMFSFISGEAIVRP